MTTILELDGKKIEIPSHITKINAICYNCSKKFSVYVSDLKKKRTSRFFCNGDCYLKIAKKKKRRGRKSRIIGLVEMMKQ